MSKVQTIPCKLTAVVLFMALPRSRCHRDRGRALRCIFCEGCRCNPLMRYPCQKNRFIHSLRKLRSFIPAIFLTARQEPYCRMPIPQIPTLSGNKALAHSHPSKNGLKGEPSPSGAMAGNCNRRAVYPLNRKNRPRITSIPFAFLFTHSFPLI